MNARALCSILLVLPALAVPLQRAAADNYRSDQPAVLTPPAPKPKTDPAKEDEIIARFQALYESKSRPKMVLFWDKELSDRLSDFETQARITHYRQESWKEKQTGAAASGGAAAKAPDGTNEGTGFFRDDINIDTRKPDRPKPQLGPLANQRMEGAFSTTFQEAKTRFLDRALLMRLTENEQRQNNAVDQPVDSKATEIEAVSKRADILVQVAMVYDPSTRAGMAYQVQVSDLKAAEVIIQFVARDEGGRPDRQRWEAGDHGYDLVTIPGYADFTQSGRALAIKTMEQLLKYW